MILCILCPKFFGAWPMANSLITAPMVKPAPLTARYDDRLVISAFVLILLCAVLVGYLTTSPAAAAAAVRHDGADLTRLMRFMAGLKALLAIGAASAVVWRLMAPVSVTRFGAYALAGAAMAAGPGLIWGMAHVGIGALLLHGGLFATILLLWRDPAVGKRLAAVVERRRAAFR
jgi:hypothetical protein